MANLVATNLPSQDVAYTNLAYVSPKVFEELARSRQCRTLNGESVRCDVKGFIFNVEAHDRIPPGSIALGKMHRHCANIRIQESILVKPWEPPHPTVAVASLEVGSFPLKTAAPITLTDEILDREFKRVIVDQTLKVDQIVTLQFNNGTTDVNVTFTIQDIELSAEDGKQSKSFVKRGIITDRTTFMYVADEKSSVTLKTQKIQQRQLFEGNFDLEKLGIGGLDKEFADIFRRAFASRIFPPHIVEEMGLNHVRGMLLYGPPGTGKTLIARQIGKALKANEPKIVNGPEVLNKFVGQSEENIRNLFADAEAEQKKRGENSSLHIIIFDEIDAICKQRGKASSSTGVNDSVVNQLLSKIDGVDSLNNILLIGMTNRLDMIDEALLRPGRLEVHLEISLPDTDGRVQILNIHTAKMRASGRLEGDVEIRKLAAETKNFSGAEIEGLIRSAASFAFNRQVNMKDLANPIDSNDIKVTRADFDKALDEVKPAYGVQEGQLLSSMPYGIIPYSEEFKSVQRTVYNLGREVKDSKNAVAMSVLVHGSGSSGKTAMACHVALQARFPFTKVISPDNFIGQSESARVDSISKVFDDAYKSQLSLVILDNIEGLLEYSPIGPRFSNVVMQALSIFVKRAPPKDGRRIFIIGTTSQKAFLDVSGLTTRFAYNLEMPLVHAPDGLRAVLNARNAERHDFPADEVDLVCRSIVDPIGIQKLLMIVDTTAQFCKPAHIRCDQFLSSLRLAGIQ